MSEIQSLARGLKILDHIVNANRGLSVTELAGWMELDKSTISRLMRTLANFEYVQQEPGTRRYVLGKRLHKISWGVLNRLSIREKAKPYLYRLVMETGECSHTAVYSDGKALVIDDVESDSSPLRVVGQTGRRIPLYCTAVGKALLAFSDWPLPTELEAKTARTITDLARLVEHMAETRAQGYALDDEEYDLGIRCIAAPVYDYMGIVIASVGISGPAVRVTAERVPPLAQVVMQAAAELSTDLGYVGGQPDEHERQPQGSRYTEFATQ